MKKNVITLIVIGVTVLGIYFVFGLVNVKPPSPTITVGDKKVEVVQGSYCWNGFINAGCIDKTSPPELIKFHELTPVVVTPESELKIEFKRKPTENILNVNKWIANEETENVPMHGNAIILPEEKGIYVYDVSAEWKKGDSSFAFVIEVK